MFKYFLNEGTKRNQKGSSRVIGLATILQLSIGAGRIHLNKSLMFVACEQ
jgi:hypothetical protein